MFKEEPVEKVKSYNYLGYILYENNSDSKHVKTQVERNWTDE